MTIRNRLAAATTGAIGRHRHPGHVRDSSGNRVMSSSVLYLCCCVTRRLLVLSESPSPLSVSFIRRRHVLRERELPLVPVVQGPSIAVSVEPAESRELPDDRGCGI